MQSGYTITAASTISTEPRTTCSKVAKALKKDDHVILDMLLNPTQNKEGRQPVITYNESELIKEQIVWAASQGFAIDTAQLQSIFAKTASDGRDTFRTSNGLPSMDTIRSWRAKNRDITFRKLESKSRSKLLAERPEHVRTLQTALQTVAQLHPGIFENPNRLWNLDETEICASNGSVRE